jgi:hypothetical protein
MSLASDVAALKAWKQTRSPAIPSDQNRRKNRLDCARGLYRDHPNLWRNFQSDPDGLWDELLIDFGLSGLSERQPHSGQPGAVIACPWNLEDEIIPFMNFASYDPIPLHVIAQWLDDAQADEWCEFGPVLTNPSGSLPRSWYEAWSVAQAAGPGLFAASKADECKAIRVTVDRVEERQRFSPWIDVAQERERIRLNIIAGEVYLNERMAGQIP